MSTEQSKSVLDLAKEAHRGGLDSPERVVARLEKLIVRNARYVDRRAQDGRITSFDELVKEDNQAIARAIVLLESIAVGTDLDWLRKYTEHVARYTAMRIASGQVKDLAEIVDSLPPMPEEEEKDY